MKAAPFRDLSSRAALSYEFAGFRLHPDRRLLTGPDGTPIKLSGKAFDALVYLTMHAGELVERSTLAHELWPKTVVEDNNLNQAVATLRRALGSKHIATVAGRGYQFVTPVTYSVTASDENAVPRHDSREQRPRAIRGRFARHTILAAMLGALLAVVLGGVSALRPPVTTVEGSETVSAIVPVTTYPGSELTPSLSPDGTKVAFSWDPGSGNRAIYITQVSTGLPLRLTAADEGEDVFPVWSPNGEQIAFLRRHDPARYDLLVVPALGGPERKLYAIRMRWISVEGYPLLAWTPDGEQLLFTTQIAGSDDDPSYSFHLLTLATGVTEPFGLDRDKSDYDTSPAFSADGKRLAFIRYHLGERLPQLFVQALGPGLRAAGPPRLVPGAGSGLPHSPTWSADCRRLCFVSDGKVMEWRDGHAARPIYTLSPSLAISGLAMAEHDGRTRAVATTYQSDADLWALPLDPSTHANIGPPAQRAKSTSFERHPAFSPDGRRIAFVSGRGGNAAIWVADADGANPRQLSHLGEFVSGFPTWSPDGERIAFHASARNEERVIYSVAVEGGVPRRLFNGCCPKGWSADGRYLYASEIANIDQVLRIRLEDGQRERLFEGDLAIESADHQWLLYAKTRQRGIFARALSGTPGENSEKTLVDDYLPPNGGIVPVADGFFYAGYTPDGHPRAFRFFDYAQNEARDIAPAPPSLGLGLTVSPDGRELVYSADDAASAADIVLMEFGPSR